MAKVKGALMSLSARGSIAHKRIVFSSRNQQTVAKSWGFDERQTSEKQKKYYQSLARANEIWKNLPEYLKDQWKTTNQNQPHVRNNSAYRAPVKGRLLFLSRSLYWVHKGHRAFASPYGSEPAPERLRYEVMDFVIE